MSRSDSLTNSSLTFTCEWILDPDLTAVVSVPKCKLASRVTRLLPNRTIGGFSVPDVVLGDTLLTTISDERLDLGLYTTCLFKS